MFHRLSDVYFLPGYNIFSDLSGLSLQSGHTSRGVKDEYSVASSGPSGTGNSGPMTTVWVEDQSAVQQAASSTQPLPTQTILHQFDAGMLNQ